MAAFPEPFELSYTESAARAADISQYTESIRHVCTIHDADELSYVLRHIKPFKDLPACNINLFRKGIPATWEHAANADGCSWSVQLNTEHANAIFEHLAAYLCLKGFSRLECNGIKTNIRRGFVRIEIWARNISAITEGAEIQEDLRAALSIADPVRFAYKSHRELISRMGQPAV